MIAHYVTKLNQLYIQKGLREKIKFLRSINNRSCPKCQKSREKCRNAEKSIWQFLIWARFPCTTFKCISVFWRTLRFSSEACMKNKTKNQSCDIHFLRCKNFLMASVFARIDSESKNPFSDWLNRDKRKWGESQMKNLISWVVHWVL